MSREIADDSVHVVGAADVARALEGQEAAVLERARTAYRLHALEQTVLPHSQFLRFPGGSANRIIALPAFLGGEGGTSGIKWIASFPGNLQSGNARASAVVILNSVETGVPRAIIEGAQISAARTAASAALAAEALLDGAPADGAALIGCGVINREIARYLRVVRPELRRFALYDLERARAEQLAEFLRRLVPDASVQLVGSVQEALGFGSLTSFATTASVPHVDTLSGARPAHLVLHVSLRISLPE